jgi:hypothetical protein
VPLQAIMLGFILFETYEIKAFNRAIAHYKQEALLYLYAFCKSKIIWNMNLEINVTFAPSLRTSI